MTDRVSPATTGPVAIITGGSSGIGLAIAHALAARGFEPTLVARDPGRLAAAAADLRDRHGVVVSTISADLSDESGRQLASNAAADPRVGVVVTAAGMPHPGAFVDTDAQALRATTALKTAGTLDIARAAAESMVGRGRGAILLVSSTGGLQGVPGVAVNSATEAYVLNLGEALHVEMRPRGVSVTTVLPGPTDTPALARMLGDRRPPGVATADSVAREALAALDAGRPTHIAGAGNRWMARVLTRRAGTRLMGAMTQRLFGAPATHWPLDPLTPSTV